MTEDVDSILEWMDSSDAKILDAISTRVRCEIYGHTIDFKSETDQIPTGFYACVDCHGQVEVR